jgi:cytochrome P450 family 144
VDHANGQRLLATDLLDDPYPTFATLRREAPVWALPGENAFLVSTWDLVAEAATRVEDFSNHFRFALFSRDDGALGVVRTGGAGPDVFAGADPPAHTAQRKIFFSELVQKRIAALEPDVLALTDELLDGLRRRHRCDLAAGLAQPIPIRVVAERVIGFRSPDIEQLGRWVSEGSRLMGGLLTMDQMAGVAGEVAGMTPWTTQQLDDALASTTRGDVLGAAATAVRDGALSREEAAFTLMVLVGAGAETTSSLIANAVRLLAERPDLQAELRAEPGKVAAFVEEVLRYDGPFRYHPRTASRDAMLGGVEIPEGAMVMLLWGAANRDEAVFECPDDFRLGRRNVHLHFGFGRGIHHCVGAALARLEARVVITRLLERTTMFTVDADRPSRWADSVWIHRLERLPLLVEHR